MTIRDGVIFWHNTMSERYNSIIKLYNFVGSKDPVQEQKIHELTECDLCARCLVEYVVIRCKKHGKKDILMDVDAANELFALMTILIGFGYLSDYYKSDTFDKVIEVLPDGLFSYPIYKDIGINKYAKIITLDKIENPEVYNKLSLLIKEPDYNYEHIYEDVFADEFGINYEDFRLITETIIGQMQADEKGELIEEIGSFKDRISGLAKIDNKVITAYINAFSISNDYHDLSAFSMFKEHDTFPCRYKRKLSLMTRPICVFESEGMKKVSFSYRGFIQSQYYLLNNIRLSNYAGISDNMKKYIGRLNNQRGNNFEAGIFELYNKNINNVICHRSAKIAPKEILQNNEMLGDIDILLIDNEYHRILLIEAKSYNECKTPYEAIEDEKKIMKDMKKAIRRDIWAKEHRELFELYAKTPTANYSVASILLTLNISPLKFFKDDYKTSLPIVWIRDVIENPFRIFEYGEYS